MALTADQITAQNFKDFYAEIRPYLNGNSPICTNVFNKSDLYDTTEKIVGRWIDGKPIYQNTFSVGQRMAWRDGSIDRGSLTISAPVSGVEHIISTLAIGEYPNGGTVSVAHVDTVTNGSNWLLYASDNVYVTYLVAQYTKTNDTQMSISDGNEYSTDEQLVGHWIDGKPVYQKTFTGTTTATTSSDSVAGTIANLGTLVDSNGTIFLEGGWGVNQHSLPYDNVAEYYVDTSNQLIIHKQNEIANSKGYMVTLRYTKTTD